MPKFLPRFIVLVTLLWLSVFPPVLAQTSDQPIVHTVLFYSPTCPHCHDVITNLLVPMMEKYGNQLQIMGIDITTDQGSQFYQFVIQYYKIPAERQGVPTLIVAKDILVGSSEIPQKFPTIVTNGLAADGIAWPDIPGFQPDTDVTPTETPPTNTVAPSPAVTSSVVVTANSGTSPETPFNTTQSAPDMASMAIAWTVMGIMIASLGLAVWRIVANWDVLTDSYTFNDNLLAQANTWLILLLTVAGLGVAIYLAYIEISSAEAVCGPVGDCNAVQSSVYAKIAGIPVAVLGIINYITLIGLWLVQKFAPARLASLSVLGMLGITLLGLFFSIYLTWIEIFILNTICLWCISSAVITTILLVLIVLPTTQLPMVPFQKSGNITNC